MKYRIAYLDHKTGKRGWVGDGVAMDEPQARKLLEQLSGTNDGDRFQYWLEQAQGEKPR